MQPNLAYLSKDGDLIESVELPPDLHRNSVRHLAVREERPRGVRDAVAGRPFGAGAGVCGSRRADGLGGLVRVAGGEVTALVSADRAWDNHLVPIGAA